MPTIDGYEPLRIDRLTVKARLAPDVWRMLSVAERPAYDADIRPVIVDDKGTYAVVLTAAHYDELVYRLRDLERWATGKAAADRDMFAIARDVSEAVRKGQP